MEQAAGCARDVIKRFEGTAQPALDGVSIDVAPGQITGLVGPDGSGKTTLIRLLAGLMEPTSGEIAILGKPPAEMLDQLGYMPQRFGLYEDLTVRENLNLYAELRALPPEEHDETFARLLAFTDLARFQDRLAGNLSGGMKQKLGLACTLVRTPKLMLLDEPSVGVDPVSRRELWSIVHSLVDQGITVLWATAYLDEAERCDAVLLLNEGRLLVSGKPESFAKRLKGRTFAVRAASGDRRAVLREVLGLPHVVDAIIKGRDVRVLVSAEADPSYLAHCCSA